MQYYNKLHNQKQQINVLVCGIFPALDTVVMPPYVAKWENITSVTALCTILTFLLLLKVADYNLTTGVTPIIRLNISLKSPYLVVSIALVMDFDNRIFVISSKQKLRLCSNIKWNTREKCIDAFWMVKNRIRALNAKSKNSLKTLKILAANIHSQTWFTDTLVCVWAKTL